MTTINLTNNTETFTLNGVVYIYHTETGRFSKTENGKTKRIGITEYQVAEAKADELDRIETVKAYWMATMAITETREQMDEVWATEEGMQDLMGWYEDEKEAGLTEEDMRKAIAETELDAAAENNEISLEQFVELVQEAEESANTEAGEEIADLYSRHPEGTDLQKPAVFNQYGCVDCSKCNVQNCVHRDCMRRNPTSEGGLAECPRLKVKAEQPKAKKERKPRKSKDIFHTSVAVPGVTLTAKQVDFIHHLPDSNFWEHGLDSSLWTDVLCDEIGGEFSGKPMTVGAMISTLCEKGLAERGKMKVNGKKCTYFQLTESGKMVAKELGLE